MQCSPYLDDARRPLTALERRLCAALLEVRALVGSGSEAMGIIDDALQPTDLQPWSRQGSFVDWPAVTTEAGR